MKTFPTADITTRLGEQVPNCDEEQLVQLLEYCKLLPMSDTVEQLLLTVLTDGTDFLRDADRLHNTVLTTLSSDPIGRVGPITENRKPAELDAARRWQDDSSLPVSVRRFADEAEQYLLNDIEQTDKMVDL